MWRRAVLTCVVGLSITGDRVGAAERKTPLPKEDVVEVPAIGPGLCVSNVFQTNMVLQRDKPVTLWGWAAPGEAVTVSLAGRQAQATAAADRTWRVTLPPMAADSRPQTLTVRGRDRTLTLENILVGDVWILGGQSNMEFPISNIVDGELEIVSANLPQIRLLTTPQGKGFDSVASFERLYEWSAWSNRHFRKGDWDVCTPQSVREFSAIGTVFGRRLALATGVPIGLIDASIGGTTVETWTPVEVLEKIEGAATQALLKDWADRIAAYDPQQDLADRIARYEARRKQLASEGRPLPADSRPPSELRPGPAADRNRPGLCFAGVMRPLRDLSVKGVLWHQGFNNCLSGSAGAQVYNQVFGPMITAWRANFGDPALPFCIISLCTAGAPQTPENFVASMYDVGPFVREAQYRTFRAFRDAGDTTIGFVSSFDQRKSWYHPQIKVPVGERAAKWALVTQYHLLTGRDAEAWWLPPSIEKVEAVDGVLRLTLSTDITTRDDSDGKRLGFAIAGADRRFYPAEVDWFTDGRKDNRNRPIYQRNVLVLSSPFVPAPLHYRHAWARNPMSNLTNGRQVPLATQRSDHWVLEETPVTFPVPAGLSPSARRRYLATRIRRELQLADTERRLQEARATLAELSESFKQARADWEKAKAAEAARAESQRP